MHAHNICTCPLSIVESFGQRLSKSKVLICKTRWGCIQFTPFFFVIKQWQQIRSLKFILMFGSCFETSVGRPVNRCMCLWKQACIFLNLCFQYSVCSYPQSVESIPFFLLLFWTKHSANGVQCHICETENLLAITSIGLYTLLVIIHCRSLGHDQPNTSLVNVNYSCLLFFINFSNPTQHMWPYTNDILNNLTQIQYCLLPFSYLFHSFIELYQRFYGVHNFFFSFMDSNVGGT